VLASIRFSDAAPGAETRRPLVLVAVRDPRLASLLDHSLVAAGYEVDCEQDALTAIDTLSPDLLLVEAPAVPQLRSRTDAPMVAFVTTGSESIEARIAALDGGADDVIAVPFEIKELLARFRALRRGRALAIAAVQAKKQQGTLAYADVQLDLDTRQVRRGERSIELRHKTFELLAFFMRHPQRVLSRRELLEHVWGYEFLGDSNVIEVTVRALRQALEGGGEPRLIFTVRPIGYILNARPANLQGPNC
jgi:two-component system, OmpR family, response regulator MprA